MTKKILLYAATLAAICAAAALGVAGTYYFTAIKDGPESPIPRKLAERRERAMELLFRSVEGEQGGAVNPDAEEADRVYRAVRDGDAVAYAAMGQGQGYSSVISVLALFDPQVERVLAVLVTDQNETPGLGTLVVDVAADATWAEVLKGEKNPLREIAALYEPPEDLESLSAFQRQFQGPDGAGLPVGQVAVEQDGGSIEAISGATTSSKAVVEAVLAAARKVRKAMEEKD